jgi:hypothetical protein
MHNSSDLRACWTKASFNSGGTQHDRDRDLNVFLVWFECSFHPMVLDACVKSACSRR